MNNRGVGATHFLPMSRIRLDSRSQAKMYVNPKKGATSPMRKILRREIRKGGVSPITVVKEGDGYRLVAGERRFMACRQLGYKRIPCRIIEPLKLEKLTPDEPDSVTEDRAALVAAFRENDPPSVTQQVKEVLTRMGQGGDDFINRRFEKLE
jgi:hypothetical protein